MKKEYILFTATNFPDGGAGANYLNLFCKGLKINGYPVRVFLLKGFTFGNYSTQQKKHNTTDAGIPYSYLGSVKAPSSVFFKFCIELIVVFNLIIQMCLLAPRRKSIRLLVYNNELHYNIVIYFLARLFFIKLISFVPEFYDKSLFSGSFFRKMKWYGFLVNFFYLNKLSYKLIVFSFYLKNTYLESGYKERDIIIQPNLTDFDYWESSNTEIKYNIGFSGTPCAENGLIDLFCAISALQKEGISIALLVVGDNIFGSSYIPELKVECEKLGINGNVNFAGLVEDLSEVRQLLSECEILALTKPSNIQTTASFPTRLGEYFATRKIILVTNFGDIEKYFKNDSELVIAQSGDIEDIAEKIKWIVKNKSQAEKLTAAGYMNAKQMLEYKTSVKKIAALID